MVYGGGVDPLKLKFDCSRCKPTVKITLLEVHPEHLPKRLPAAADRDAQSSPIFSRSHGAAQPSAPSRFLGLRRPPSGPAIID